MKVIEVNNLTKKFGSFTAVDHISFSVSDGEIFGFLGANGAGKTTAMRMLCGLLRPTSGNSKIAGYNIYNQSNMIKKNIGYMSQKFSLYNDLTIKENINLFGGIYEMNARDIKEKSIQLIDKLNLKKEQNQLVGSLPLGIKQKLAFAVSTFHNPKIIFLDEPTGGVDPIARRVFWDMIHEQVRNGMTAFVTTHYMDEAEYCDRISMMVDGQIVALDTPSNLKKSYETDNLDDVFFALARKATRGDD